MGLRPPRFPILVTDVDGTLVDAHQEILPANALAIARYRARGGRVVLATGRIEAAVARYRDALRLTGPAVLYNGARVVDIETGDVLVEWPLMYPASVVVHAGAAVDPRIVAIAFGHGRVARATGPSPVRDAVLGTYEAKDGITVDRAPDPARLTRDPVLKVLFLVPAECADEVTATLAEALPEAAVIRSEATYVEVLAKGVDKGRGLAWLLHHLGADGDQVVAIGDNLNDREMLAMAGVGAAVGDGHPGLRQAADVVVGPRDAGAVADAVAIALGEQSWSPFAPPAAMSVRHA